MPELNKILFVSSYAPPSLAGAPQFMYKLIQALPAESYTVLTSFYNIDTVSAKIGTWLPGEYVFYDKPFARKGYHPREDTNVATGTSWLANLKRLMKRNPFIKSMLAAFFILIQIPFMIWLGCQIARNQKVDVVMGFSDYGPAMVATYFIHCLTKVPFYIYLFDLYKGNLYPLTGELLADWFEPRLIKAASKIIVTNEGTKQVYCKRYGDYLSDKIVVLYNSTDPKPYLELQTPYQPESPYTILFPGNVYWPQIRSLQNLIKALDRITDLNIRFKIYTPHPKEYLHSLGLDSPKIDLSVAPNSEMPKIQSQADILFLPLSWHTASPEIINTATPGKLTEYLIAGRPILVHAPKESYLVEYAKENDFALVVDEENIDELANAVRRLLTDTELANRIIRNAQATFMRNHDITQTAEKFKNLFVK